MYVDVKNFCNDLNAFICSDDGNILKGCNKIKSEFGCEKIVDLKSKVRNFVDGRIGFEFTELSDDDFDHLTSGIRLIERNLTKLYRNEKPWYTNLLDRLMPNREGAVKRKREIEECKNDFHNLPFYLLGVRHKLMMEQAQKNSLFPEKKSKDFSYNIFRHNLIRNKNFQSISTKFIQNMNKIMSTKVKSEEDKKKAMVRQIEELLKNSEMIISRAEGEFPDGAHMDALIAAIIAGGVNSVAEENSKFLEVLEILHDNTEKFSPQEEVTFVTLLNAFKAAKGIADKGLDT